MPQIVSDAVAALAADHLSVSWGDRLLTLDKSAGFKDEPAFARAFAAIRGSHQYDQYNGPDSIAWRLNTLIWAGRCALRTGGEFVECGTFKGDMAWVVLRNAGRRTYLAVLAFRQLRRTFARLLDGRGLPRQPRLPGVRQQDLSASGLYEYVHARFAPYDNVSVVRGFLPEMLDIAMPGEIGFLHIDLNSPRAEIAVLEKLFDRVVPGGVIVFDDYGWKMFRRQKEAEDAFMASAAITF